MFKSVNYGIKRLPFVFLLLAALLSVPVLLVPSSSEVQAGSKAINWHDVIAKTSDKGDVESRLLRGIAYANLGRLPESFKEFEIAGQEAYTDEIASFVLGKVGDLRRAPEDLLLLNCVAFGSYAFGDFAASTDNFEHIIRLDPKNVWARNFAAIAYGQVGEFDKALHHLQGALAIDTKNQYTHLLLSAVYKEKNQYLMAAYHYLQAPDAVKELHSYGIL